MELTLNQWIVTLMGITLNFSTGEIGWSSGTTTGDSDISGGLDNLLLTDGDNFLLTSSGEDVLLLT